MAQKKYFFRNLRGCASPEIDFWSPLALSSWLSVMINELKIGFNSFLPKHQLGYYDFLRQVHVNIVFFYFLKLL